MKWDQRKSQNALLLGAILALNLNENLSDVLILAAIGLTGSVLLVAPMAASIIISSSAEQATPELIYYLSLSVPYLVSAFYLKNNDGVLALSLLVMPIFMIIMAVDALMYDAYIIDSSMIYDSYSYIVIAIHCLILRISHGIVYLPDFAGFGDCIRDCKDVHHVNQRGAQTNAKAKSKL